jgi:hypothetical protein
MSELEGPGFTQSGPFLVETKRTRQVKQLGAVGAL